METKQGVCENCPEEDMLDKNSHSQEQTLYKIRGCWVCGDCANEWEHEREFYNSEYPND